MTTRDAVHRPSLIRRLVALGLGMGVAAPGLAATSVVTTTTDGADGLCAAQCTLREAINAANALPGADTVQVPAGRYLLTLRPLGDEVGLSGDLDIQDAVIVQGAGAALTVIDAGGAGRVFHVDPEGDQPTLQAELRALTVQGGNDPFGAGIVNLAQLTLTDVAVSNNRSTANGGGILNAGRLSLLRAVIAGNTATTAGAGIFNDLASMDAVDTRFEGNAAGGDGGAVFHSRSTASIGGTSRFLGNTAAGGGGALYVAGTAAAPASVAVSAEFRDNRAGDGGAVLLQPHATLEARDSQFVGNLADGLDFNGGGAVFSFGGGVRIERSRFERNRAFGEGGGALLVGGGAGAWLVVRHSDFVGNRAETHAGPLPGSSPGLGGAMLVIAGTTATLEHVTLQGNVAAVSGGAIYVDRDVQFRLADAHVDGNTATAQFGGGVNSEGTALLERVRVRQNRAGLSGGGISTGFGALTLVDSLVQDNAATDGAGLFAFNGGLTVRRATIAGNTALGAGAGGGGLLMGAATATIENATFSGNDAAGGGAGVTMANANGSLTLAHVTFAGNTTRNDRQGSAVGTFNGAQATLRNTLVHGTCNAAVRSDGGNLESPGSSCGLGGAGDRRNVADPGLLPLADHGGPTPTHDLAPSSPAIDAVPVAACTGGDRAPLAADQRGAARPQDGDGDQRAACDVGAVEYGRIATIHRDGFEGP